MYSQRKRDAIGEYTFGVNSEGAFLRTKFPDFHFFIQDRKNNGDLKTENNGHDSNFEIIYRDRLGRTTYEFTNGRITRAVIASRGDWGLRPERDISPAPDRIARRIQGKISQVIERHQKFFDMNYALKIALDVLKKEPGR